MNLINKIAIILVTILLAIIAVQQFAIRKLRNVNNVMQADTVVQHVTHYDTVYPTPITLVSTVYDTIIDTILVGGDDIGGLLASSPTEIERDWRAVRSYDDVLKDDSTGYVRVQSTVSHNRLMNRRLFFESRCQNRTITINKPELYYTFSLMASKQRNGISGGIIYKDLNNRLFRLEIGYLQEPYIGLGVGFSF